MPINFCKSCFKEIKFTNLPQLIKNNKYLCINCFKQMIPQWYKSNLGNFSCLSIYEYNGFIKEKIYLYKKMNDYELSTIFLDKVSSFLKIKYKNYLVIPIPSYLKDDEERGYNHVVEIFKHLNLPMIDCLIKTENIKQKDLNFNERHLVKKYLKVINSSKIRNKNILIVDDILTTGSTVKAAAELISNYSPKKIEILTVAKNFLKPLL